jgi:general secretion pathway protein J
LVCSSRPAGNLCSSQQPRHSQGFTLIELLVAITILGGLLAVTFSGFRLALTMWEKGRERTEAFNERVTTLSILRDQLRNTLPLFYTVETLPTPKQQLAFDGKADRLAFVTRASWRDGTESVPRWVEWKWDGRLVIDERLIIPPLDIAGASIWHSEVHVFEDFQLSFLRRKTAESSPEWTASWDLSERQEIPVAIQVKYKIDGKWDALIVPLNYADANIQGYSFQ